MVVTKHNHRVRSRSSVYSVYPTDSGYVSWSGISLYASYFERYMNADVNLGGGSLVFHAMRSIMCLAMTPPSFEEAVLTIQKVD